MYIRVTEEEAYAEALKANAADKNSAFAYYLDTASASEFFRFDFEIPHYPSVCLYFAVRDGCPMYREATAEEQLTERDRVLDANAAGFGV